MFEQRCEHEQRRSECGGKGAEKVIGKAIAFPYFPFSFSITFSDFSDFPEEKGEKR